MSKTAFYPGSFDPLTNGHLDVLRQACRIADEIIVGVGIHPGKQPLFSFEERSAMISHATRQFSANISVVSFDGLVVNAAKEAGASSLIRGLRDGTDLDYEMQMSGMNGVLEPEIATIFVPATPQTRHITATLVRQISKMGGDVSAFVPKNVLEALHKKG